MGSWARRAAQTTELVAFALGIAGCASTQGKPLETIGRSPSHAEAAAEGVVAFSFDSLDARPVTSEAMRGQPTVLTFVAIGNLGSQAQVNYLVAMAKNDGERVHYAVIAVEPRDQRELVEIYRGSLGASFPFAMADEASLIGTGPFGDLRAVPTTVILDAFGKLRFRADGRIVKSDELRAELRKL